MMKEIRQRRVVSLLPPRLHVVIVNIFVLFMCTSHAQIINSTTAPPSSSTTSTSRPSSSSTTLPSGVTTIPLPSSTFQRLTLYQYVSNRGGTQLSYSGAISPGAKMIFQVDVSLVQQFVVFNLSYPFQNNIQMNLWKAYNLTSLTGIPYPYNTSSLPPLQGIWSSTPTPYSDFNVPGSFLVLKPNTPAVKDMCALAHSVTAPCTFFLELTNMNTTGSTNYVLDLMIGLMLSFNAGADIAASRYDPTHTQFSPLPFQLPFPGSLPPNTLGIYGFEIAPADLDVLITMAPSTNIPNNYLFQLAVTVAESDPFVNQLTVANNQQPNSAVQVDVNGGPGFQEGLYIFLVYVGVTPPYDPTLMTTFQFTAITGYNPDSYFGLSMFGIVGALTVLVLCLFSAAAVIARRRRAADIRAYGTAGVQMENRPPPGASEEQISLLETQVYKKGAGTITDEDAKCAVCLCDYEENDRLKMLPCKHHFHTTCVTTWLKQRKHCPLCQQDIENAHDVKKPGSDRPLSPPVSATAVQPVVDGFPPHVVPDASSLDASPNPRSSSSSTSASGSDSSLASSASSVASIMALPQAHLQLVRPPAVSVTSQTRVLPVNSAHVTLTVGSGDDGKRS